ncbi:hypothetical protein EVC20_098 [Rhizobium phage RHph_Y2_17_1]|nr:hypothetical protein EVC19_098 [Rhizobium phage RHph_Y2_11]QIG75837.1 hypothetical protein EVC20_098 [Rhizobium phage RHph_Y2_17_1]
MTTQGMKTLNDGTEIAQETFGSIFGGGLKKALDQPRKIKIDGQDFHFTIRDMKPLQAVIDQLVRENFAARSEADRLMEENASLKGRLRQLDREIKIASGKRPVGRPRKYLPEEAQNVVSIKPRVRVQANSFRSAA